MHADPARALGEDTAASGTGDVDADAGYDDDAGTEGIGDADVDPICAVGANGNYGGKAGVIIAAGGVDAGAIRPALGKDRRLLDGKLRGGGGGGSSANRVHADPNCALGEHTGAAETAAGDAGATVGTGGTYVGGAYGAVDT